MKIYKLPAFFILVLITCTLTSGSLHAQTGWKWLIGGVQNDSTIYEEETSTIDARGNIIMAGVYVGGDSLVLGASTVIHFPSYDSYMLLTKTDTSGNVLWAIKGKSVLDVRGIVTDDTGNVYVCGIYDTLLAIGSYHLTASSWSGYFLKFSPSGSLIWARNIALGIESMDIDKANNIYIAGFFNGSMTLDGITLPGSGSNYSLFIAKFAPSSLLTWLKSLDGGSCSNYWDCTTVSENGVIYLAGHFSTMGSDTTYWHVTMGTTVLTAHHSGNTNFITKLDSSGHVVWAHYLNDSVTVGAMIADGKDQFYVTGYFKDSATFNSTTFTSVGMEDMFITKYDSAGHLLWANSAGGERSDYGFELALDKCGSLWVGGAIGYATFPAFSGPDSSYVMNFNSSLLHAQPRSYDALFAARYDTSGVYVSGFTLPSGADDWFCMKTDNHGNLYVGGDYLRATMSLAGTTLYAHDTTVEYFFMSRYKYDQGGCYDVVHIPEYVAPLIDLGEGVSVYPNPSQNSITIKTTKKIKNVAITNLLGQVVYQGEFDNSSIYIDVSNLTTGIYLLKINGGEVRKFLKE